MRCSYDISSHKLTFRVIAFANPIHAVGCKSISKSAGVFAFSPLASPFYAIPFPLSSDFFKSWKIFSTWRKVRERTIKRRFCAYWRRLHPLDKCRISKHRKLSSCFFKKIKTFYQIKTGTYKLTVCKYLERLRKINWEKGLASDMLTSPRFY